MTTTNSQAAEHATQNNALRLGRMQLIGTFGPETDLRALLRHPDGQIETLTVGSQTAMGRVVAIAQGTLHIAQADREKILHLP